MTQDITRPKRLKRWRGPHWEMHRALGSLEDAARRGQNPDPVYWVHAGQEVGWIYCRYGDGFDHHVGLFRSLPMHESHIHAFRVFDRAREENRAADLLGVGQPWQSVEPEIGGRGWQNYSASLADAITADWEKQETSELPAFVVDAVNREYAALDEALYAD